MDYFEKDARAKFEERMLVHLKKYFPEVCNELGEEEVRVLIRYGTDKAEKYGITSGNNVCLFIDVMFVFGKDFDTDPSLPWGAAILQSALGQNRKTKVLFDTALNKSSDARGISSGAKSNG